MKTTRKKLVLKRETLQALDSRSLRDAVAGGSAACTTASQGTVCTTQNLSVQSECRTCI